MKEMPEDLDSQQFDDNAHQSQKVHRKMKTVWIKSGTFVTHL